VRILVITHLFSPDRGGGASVFSDLCFGLAEKGHQVEVFAGYPYYPEWRNKSGANLWKIKDEAISGVRIKRFGFYIPTRPSSLFQRLLYETSFTISLLRSFRHARRYDLVMVYCPLLGSVLFAVLRKWVLRDRLWLNVQDIPADAAAASGISQSWLFDSFAFWIQAFLFRRAEVVSTISPIMLRRVTNILGGGSKPIYFPNWLNRSIGEIIERKRNAKRLDDGTDHAKLLYAGNIGRKQGLIDCCERLAGSRTNFHLRIFGDGSEADNLKSWIQSGGDKRFSIGRFLPEEQFVAELVNAHFFLITETAQVGASFIPSKLIPCIATGTPIIAVCDEEGPLGYEVSKYNLGVVVKWSEIERMPDLLTMEVIRSGRYRGWCEQCLKHSEVYRRDAAIRAVEIYGARPESR